MSTLFGPGVQRTSVIQSGLGGFHEQRGRVLAGPANVALGIQAAPYAALHAAPQAALQAALKAALKAALVAVLPAALLLALPLVGCGPSKVITIRNAEEFRAVVLESDLPVLVDFYKGACPVCWPVLPTLEVLAKDYQGRAKVASFEIMTGDWRFPYPEIKEKYGIYGVPQVVLFNKGVPVAHWVMVYFDLPYRWELDKLVSPASREKSPPTPAGPPSR